jgi:hypothetical protein
MTRELLTLGLILEETIDLGDGSVEGHNGEAVVGGVQDQVLAHDRKANETEITTGFGLRRADLEASQSRSRVSILFVNRGDHQGKSGLQCWAETGDLHWAGHDGGWVRTT